MKRFILCSLMLLGLATWLFAKKAPPESNPANPPEDPSQFDLFLLIGQSNMAGRGAVTGADQKADPRILVLNAADEWASQGEPIHFDKEIAGTGLGFAFAKLRAEESSGIVVGLIPCAVGGTEIALWQPGEALYENAVRRAKLAMKSGRLRGILWHQGESDSNQKNEPLYQERLVAMVTAFRKDLNASDIPFLVGELGDDFCEKNIYAQKVNERLKALPAEFPNVAVVPAAGLTCNPDKIHFNAASLKEFGKRYFDVWKKREGVVP